MKLILTLVRLNIIKTGYLSIRIRACKLRDKSRGLDNSNARYSQRILNKFVKNGEAKER